MIKKCLIVLFIFLFINSIEAALLTINVEIPEKYRNISAGEDLLIIMNIANRMLTDRVDVLLSYTIKDKNNSQITSKSETVAIEAQSSFSRTFKIPKDTLSGDYTIYVEVEYNNHTAIASKSFEIIEIAKKEKDLVKFFLIMFSIIFAIALAYEHFRISSLLKISEDNLKRLRRQS